jgi:putative phage-type endonuclease
MSAPQGTPEWLQERCGKVGASSIGDLMARTKTGYGASRANLMARLLTERLPGKPTETFVSGPMLWGIETEPQARAAYEFSRDIEVIETGWVPHWGIEGAGCSPDGLVGDHGLVEIKCPNTATHVDTLLGKEAGNGYLLQMQWQMECTRRQWCDFVSFDPRLPLRMQLFVQRFKRDDRLISDIKMEVNKFLAELDLRMQILNEKYPAENTQ